jgi:hypothetical protein
MPRPKTLRQKIENRIAHKAKDSVFLTWEFRDLGGESQVLRTLRVLVRDGRLVHLDANSRQSGFAGEGPFLPQIRGGNTVLVRER